MGGWDKPHRIGLLGAFAAACAPRPAHSGVQHVVVRKPAQPAPPALGDAGRADSAASDASHMESLLRLRLLGPKTKLADVCGARCRVRRNLPKLAPFKRVFLAEGADQTAPWNAHVVATYVVFEADGGLYGALVMRAGSGTRDVELVNPRNAGMPPFGHMRRTVTYAAKLRNARPLHDRATGRRYLALEVTSSRPLEATDLIVCGVTAERRPECGRLRTTPEPGKLVGYDTEHGVLNVHWTNTPRDTYALGF